MNSEPIPVVSTVILDDYGRMLLLHNTEHDPARWETPGGKVEAGESLEAAAVRETVEEAGVRVQIIRRLGETVLELPKGTYRLYWLLAKIIEGEPYVAEAHKFDDMDHFDIEDLPSLSLSPGLQELQERLLSGEIVLSEQ